MSSKDDPAWLEREYSPRLAVPDHGAYFRRWTEESAAARAQLPCRLDLRYGGGEKETLDLFPAPAGRGLLVFIHGGFWRAFDKADFSWVALRLVPSGWGVAVLNYTLCPRASVAGIADECRRAVAWLHRHGREHGVEAERLVLAGHSAGGHLVGMLFATDWAALGVPENTIFGGVSISGLFDLEPLVGLPMNADLRLDPQSARALSPAYLEPRVAAPLTVAVGELESGEFHRQSRLIVAAWPGCASRLEVLSGSHHFSALDRLAPLVLAGPW